MMGYCLNAGDDGGQVIPDFVIRKAEDSKAATSQNILPFTVGFNLAIEDRAIDLNDQSQRVAIEIDDEAIDDLLTAKLVAIEPIGTQLLPQISLGRCHLPP